MIDEEIAEIRRIRRQISAQFEHDPRKVVAYYRTLEKEFRESGEFRFVQIHSKGESSERRVGQADAIGT